MPLEANKAIVRRYFEECLDKGDPTLVPQLFAPDCRWHRPELPEPLVGPEHVAQTITWRAKTYSHFVSILEHLIAEGDLVAVRLRHEVVHRTDWTSRVGPIPAAGKPVAWTANVFFRLRDGKIVEEWIERDEAGMLQQLGALRSPPV